MRYWWVNQNQTYEHEVQGGYLWSPRRRSDGAINPFYESMREVAPGDLIFSFQGTYIRTLGIAESNARESPKPAEFGGVGLNWEHMGWRVDVHYETLHHQIRPTDHMDVIRPHLPARYSPLQDNGRGNQVVYLTWVDPPLAEALLGLIGKEGFHIREAASKETFKDIGARPAEIEERENHIIKRDIETSHNIPDTEKLALIQARRGQGLFRKNLMRIEHACRITKVDRLDYLVASHTKPWSDSTNAERLDGENGLLLTPSIDRLFDRGLISFEGSGELLISPAADIISLTRMGVATDHRMMVGAFSDGQRRYLEYHRQEVFLKSQVTRDA